MRSRLNVWVGALAALFLGIPLAGKAAAGSSDDAADIVDSALSLTMAIVDASMQAS